MALGKNKNKSVAEKYKKAKYDTTDSIGETNSRLKRLVQDPPIKVEIKEEPKELKTGSKEVHHSSSMKNGFSNFIPIINKTDINKMAWRKLACKPTQLRIDIVLKCGQSFRWTTPFKDRHTDGYEFLHQLEETENQPKS